MILASHKAQLQREPFAYSVVARALPPNVSAAILEWLETDAPWSLRIASFYEQYEFSFADAVLPETIRTIFDSDELLALRRHIEKTFDTTLDSRIDITAHKLVRGQRIRIHNDFIPGQETHRLLIQLNRGWSDENGGALIFFNSDSATDIHRIFRPLHNTGVLFEISPKSLHAVSAINDGERFTLVFSFYREPPCENLPRTLKAV